MKCLSSLEDLSKIIQTYFRKGSLTNNFMLLDAYESYIANSKLWIVSDENNAFLLLHKEDFWQLYFYLNDSNYTLPIPSDKPVVIEILYRGLVNRPKQLIDYWEKLGFKEHLSRDNLQAEWNKISFSTTIYKNIQIKIAVSERELAFTKSLFENTFDPYTSDHLSDKELHSFMKNKNLLCAYYNKELAGVLQFEIKNKVVWLGHIAIHPDYRGRGIANALVHNYITLNKTDNNTRYALWVIQNNDPAVNLYHKFGFIYGNKSTVSLLKT